MKALLHPPLPQLELGLKHKDEASALTLPKGHIYLVVPISFIRRILEMLSFLFFLPSSSCLSCFLSFIITLECIYPESYGWWFFGHEVCWRRLAAHLVQWIADAAFFRCILPVPLYGLQRTANLS